MKVSKLLFTFLLFILLLTGCSNNNTTYIKIDRDSEKQTEVMIKNEESFFLIIGRDGCPACANYLPIIEKIASKHPETPIYYTALSYISEKIENIQTILVNHCEDCMGELYVPITTYYIKGVLSYMEIGVKSETELENVVIEFKLNIPGGI